MGTKRDCLLPGGLSDLTQWVRVISKDSQHLGVMTLYAATELADEQEAELLLLGPNCNPPVCRIIDRATFRRHFKGRKPKP
jgi:translation initiation factor IF-3